MALGRRRLSPVAVCFLADNVQEQNALLLRVYQLDLPRKSRVIPVLPLVCMARFGCPTMQALGIAVVALATWGVKHVDDFKVDKLSCLVVFCASDGLFCGVRQGTINGGSVQTAQAAGALLIVVSVFGFVGVILHDHKFGRFLLIMYNIIVFLLIGLTLAGAGLVIVFANKIVRCFRHRVALLSWLV
jgi:hypothetical protein